MAVRKALLIQDISELMLILQPYFEKALDTYMYDDIEPVEAWKWVIEHELELIFGLVSKYHLRNQRPYQMFHSYLNSMTTAPLSRIIAAQVGVPIVDYDHTVEIDIRGRDLYIYYIPSWKSLLELRNYIKHLHHEQPTKVVFGPKANSKPTF